MTSCVFCRILRGEAPATIVFEAEHVVGFLDIAPINPGHALVIPRAHHVSLTTVPAAVLSEMMVWAPKVGQALARETDSDGFNLHLANGKCAGQAVPHVHLHVIPRIGTDGFSWNWRHRGYESADAATELALGVSRRLNLKPDSSE